MKKACTDQQTTIGSTMSCTNCMVDRKQGYS